MEGMGKAPSAEVTTANLSKALHASTCDLLKELKELKCRLYGPANEPVETGAKKSTPLCVESYLEETGEMLRMAHGEMCNLLEKMGKIDFD